MSKVQKVSTCLWFDRDGEDAAKFYVSLIPNSRITGLSRYGEAAPMPAGTALIVTFELAGTPYMALNGGPRYQQSEAASIMVYCDDQAEIDRLWSALTTDGGKEIQCGWLRDKFGVFWQITPTSLMEMMTSKDEVRKARAFAEMMTMVKLDIARLDAAWNG